MNDKSKYFSQRNEKTGVSEPLVVNRHSEAERWENDPTYISADLKKEEKKFLETHEIISSKNGVTHWKIKGAKDEG